MLTACNGYPRDADELTRHAAETGMRVGASHEPPYVRIAADGSVSGIDAALVEGFAREHGYRVTWVVDAHDELMRELSDAKLHAVVGGHQRDTPWKPKVGWSQPYHVREGGDGPMHARHIALPPGQPAWHLAVDRYLAERETARREHAR